MRKTIIFIVFCLSLNSLFAVTFENPLQKKLLSVPHFQYYKEEYYLVPESDLMVFEDEKNGVFLSVSEVHTIESFIEENTKEEIKNLWMEKTKKSVVQSGSQGLIPDFDIPISLGPVSSIFGEGGKLKVGGSQSIKFGGSKHIWKEQPASPIDQQRGWMRYFPDLQMEQRLLVDLTGTVGDKIDVDVHHNSQAESELKNKIKLTYTGREDEIIKKIEAGDTDLSLPRTSYASMTAKRTGLFGIKGYAKLGGLDLIAIASKEQGEGASAEFRGETKVESFQIWDGRYLKNRFFRIGDDRPIDTIRVYVDDRYPINNDKALPGQAYVDFTSTEYEDGMFDLMTSGEDYALYNELYGYKNVIEFFSPLGEHHILAVYYVTEDGERVGDITYDPNDPGSRIKLKTIKPSVPDPQSITWYYPPKNIYDIGSTEIDRATLKIKIRKAQTPGSVNEEADQDGDGPGTYLYQLGIDPNNDGIVEENYIDWERGYLIFPYLEPFRLVNCNPAIYDSVDPRQNELLYYLDVKYRTSKPTFNLGHINIIEGSETVLMNGVELTRDKDYDMDYDIGIVTFKTSVPEDAEIKIYYEWAPFISLSSKTFLGLRGMYKLSDNFELGSSFLFRSVANPVERPRLGEEPTRMMLGELDGRVEFHPDFLTRAVDLLPLIETEAASKISISGEVASSFPNPNTKNDAYIDDMEGTTMTNSLPIGFMAWIYGSIPVGKDTSNFAKKPLLWYNPKDGVRAGDIHPGLSPEEREKKETVLNLNFTPEDTTSWSSIFTGGFDWDITRYSFLEVWVKGESGKLVIDLAKRMDEDGIRRDKFGQIKGYSLFDTEDQPEADGKRNGILDEDEDTGLDGVIGSDGQNISGDDGNDDYQYESGSDDYSKVTGTENNKRLDTEDINGNTVWNTFYNDYFEYVIDISDTVISDTLTVYNEYGWKLYRIPLYAYSDTVGKPDLRYIESARIWLTGFDATTTIQIYSISVVGNRWENEGVSILDTTVGPVEDNERFVVATINNHDNPDYHPPFDPGTDRYGKPMKESSLELRYELGPRHKASCYKLIPDPTEQNFAGYEDMRFWIKKTGETLHNPQFYLKFGRDSSNYYEYRTEITATAWREVRLKLKDFTEFKRAVYETTDVNTVVYTKGEISFKGSPSITQVVWMRAGVVNTSSENTWKGRVLFNELRLSKPKRNIGIAGNMNIKLNIADVMTINGAYRNEGCEFRNLTGERKSGASTENYSLSGSTDLNKFLPQKWGLSIPVTASINEGKTLPKYSAGNDIELSEEEKKREKTVSRKNSQSISFRKTGSTNPLLKLTLDALSSLTLSRSYRFFDSPQKRDSVTTLSASFKYGYSPKLPALNFFNIFSFSYFPSSIGFGGNYNKNRSIEYTKATDNYIKRITQTGGFGASTSYNPISIPALKTSLRTSASFRVSSDFGRGKKYYIGDTDYYVTKGEDIGMGESFSASIAPNFWNIINPSISCNAKYSETHQFFLDAETGDSIKILNFNNNSSISGKLPLNPGNIISKLTHIRDKKNDQQAKSWTPHWMLMKIEDLSKYIPSFNYNGSWARNSAYYGRPPNRAAFKYQLGIEDTPYDTIKTSQDKKGNTKSHRVTSGFKIWKFNLNGSYQLSRTETEHISNPGNNSWSSSKTWPEFSLSISSIEKLPLVKRVWSSSHFGSGFSINTSKRGGMDKEKAKSKSEATSISPSLDIKWKIGINTDIHYTYNWKHNEDYQAKTEANDKSHKVGLSVGYSFSAPTGIKFPLLSRIKFKSTLSMSFSFSYSQNFSESSFYGSEMVKRKDTNRTDTNFSLSYRFSSAVTGGLNGRFSRTRNKLQGRTDFDTGLDVSVDFRF